ncbi:MAG: HypC/HybG/HupF family hydrogenase formation chaperone [Thermodesulfobacteriota bacterium]
MCIAVPVRITSIDGDTAWCSPDQEQTRIQASLLLLDEEVQVGDYVLLHAGLALRRVDPEEAEETLHLMQEMLQAEEALHTWGEGKSEEQA